MPLSERNIELIIRLLAAHQARYAEMQEVGMRLLNPMVYRSRDGTIAVGQLSDEDKERLTTHIRELLDEAEVIASNIRNAIA